MTGCTFPGCDRLHYASGLCRSHYMQRWRGSELRPIGPPIMPATPTRPLRAVLAAARELAPAGGPVRIDAIADRLGLSRHVVAECVYTLRRARLWRHDRYRAGTKFGPEIVAFVRLHARSLTFRCPEVPDLEVQDLVALEFGVRPSLEWIRRVRLGLNRAEA